MVSHPAGAAGFGVPLKSNDGSVNLRYASIGRTVPEASLMSVREDQRTIRCLIAKVGLDGHDRGAHVISRAFRDAGFEVIYSGLHNTPEEIVQATVQEDVDVLGISILSGAHNTLVPKIVDGLREYGALKDTLLIVGGTIPDDDKDYLINEVGVDAVFGPGTPLEKTISFVRNNAPER